MKKQLTKQQIKLIEDARYGVATGIYDASDMEFYAAELNLKLNEVYDLVGINAPKTVDETAIQPSIDKLHEMTYGKMREKAKELLKGEKAKCVYEKWVREGFLTEATCSEEIAEEMMKDDDVCEEMYESCMSVDECGESGGSWMKTRAGAKGPVFENDDELPVPIEDNPEDHEEGMEEENPEDVIKLDVPLLIRLLEFSKENAETDVDLHKLAEHLVTMMGEDPDRILSIDDYEAILQDLADIDTGDKPEAPANNPEDEVKEPEEEDEGPTPMFESEMPNFVAKKGSNIDSENAKNEKDTLTTVVADVDAQSETQEEKVEHLKNQKYSDTDEDTELMYKLKGKSPADFTLDLENPEYEKRTELEMKTGDSRERDENAVGKKANIGDAKVFTIKPDGTDVSDSLNGGEEEAKKHKERKKTDFYYSEPLQVKHLDEAEQKLDRIKELIKFDGVKLNKPTNKINEDIDFMKVYNKMKNDAKK